MIGVPWRALQQFSQPNIFRFILSICLQECQHGFLPFPSLPLRKEQSSSGSLVIINSQDNVYQINPLREDLHDEPKSPFFLSFFFTEKKK